MTKTFNNFTDLMDFSRSSGGTALRKVSYGSELVTNGTFDTDTTGWAAGGSATISVVSNKIRVTNGAAAYGYAYQSVSTVVGRIYTLNIDVAAGTADGFVRVGTSVGGNEIYNGFDVNIGNHTVNFVATTTTTWLRIGCSTNVASEYCDFDNVSVKEVTLDSGSDDPVLFNHPADTPRIEYATDGTVKGLLIEEARTNLLPYSEAFDNAAWGKVNSSLSTNVTTAPDGTTTADKLIANTSLVQHRLDLTPTSTAGDQTLSVYIKDAGYGFAWLRIGLSGAMFSIADNTITNIVAGVTASSQDVGNGWRLMSISLSASANDTARINVIEAQDGSDFAGDGTSGIYVWGAQLEQGPFSTSYIPTSGATATRSADNASINVENFGINPDEGTFVVDFEMKFEAGGTGYPSVFQFGSSVSQIERILWYVSEASSNLAYEVRTANVTQANNSASLNNTSPLSGRVALAVKEDDIAACLDGGTVLTDTSADVSGVTYTRDTIQFGNAITSTNSALNGHIRDFQYYPRRLTNRQLQELTGATNTYDYTTVEAGTITRSPVATGSDLVAYSGFSATNYLEQPYNSDLDFGTGDFCIMGWVKTADTYSGLVDRGTGTLGFGNSFALGGNGTSKLYGKVGASSGYSSADVWSRTWRFVCLIRRSGVAYFYVDGQASGSFAAADSVTNTSAITRLGLRTDGAAAFDGFSYMALFRISATAPTAEQIAKIYEDEKVLFQEGAQATLYGSSDAVTALAHDNTTNLLHVGTSAGRSVFQGLRRVENTTDAVGTAISASNGMVVEE